MVWKKKIQEITHKTGFIGFWISVALSLAALSLYVLLRPEVMPWARKAEEV